jgi:hypothetical protein
MGRFGPLIASITSTSSRQGCEAAPAMRQISADADRSWHLSGVANLLPHCAVEAKWCLCCRLRMFKTAKSARDI